MQRIWILLAFMISFCGKAQIQSSIYEDGILLEKRNFGDSLALTIYLRSKHQAWVENGYLFSGLDSIQLLDTTASIFLHKGEKVPHELPGLSRKKLLSQISRQLEDFSESGYPFARIKLDRSSIRSGSLYGELAIDPGPEITNDSIHFFSKVKTNKSYIYQLLDVVPNAPFKESSYQNIESRFDRSPFLNFAGRKDISFQNKKAKIFLDVEELKTNTFQGVLGLQQSNDRSPSVVGSLDLNILNLFRSGKELTFFWERFSESSQKLDIYYKHPFFLNSKIHPVFAFSLLKQDTSFLTRQVNIGLSTFISPKTSLEIAFENTNGSLITTNEDVLRDRDLADFKRNLYRLKISKGHFNTLSTLQNDWVWSVAILGGNKTITRNVSLPATYYDTINLETNFFRYDMRLGYQYSIGKRQTIFNEIRSGGIVNDEILTNELIRVGGLQTLRGFDEKIFFTEYYALSRLELRSFFERGSYAYVFYDQLLFRRGDENQSPFGVGLGFVLSTSSGQFNFALASGNSTNQNISFSDMKVHFGYISRF